MAEEYVLGTPVWFEGTFTSKDTGGLADPAEITVNVWEEGDTAADVKKFTLSGGEVEKVGEGVYRVKATATKGGRLYADFVSSGNVEVAAVEYAIITDPGVPS